MLSGRGLCDGPIPCPEVVLPTVVCHCVESGILTNEAALARVGLLRKREGERERKKNMSLRE